MTTEDLMKVRYILIADYIGNTQPIGYIFEAVGVYYDKFTANFRKLQWWEERSIEDLKEIRYVLYTESENKEVHEVTEWGNDRYYGVYCLTKESANFRRFPGECKLLPATEQCNTTGYINVAPTPSPEEQKLICSLDAQQCQQECKHKSDRTKCPFTNPIKEEGKEVKEEKQVTLTDHEIKGIAELWIKTINGEYEYANATSFAAGFKMAMLLYYKPSTPLSPAHFIAGYTAKQ